MPLTKEQAAERLGCKVRTLELYVQQGKLTTQYIKGKRGKLAQYDEVEIDALKESLEQSGDYARRPAVAPGNNLAALAKAVASNSVIEMLAMAMRAQRAPVATTLTGKMTLTTKQAAEVTQLSRDKIRAAVKAGKLRNIGSEHRVLIRCSDLDAWLESL
jgi:excisionase family DNA binding protein